MSDSLGANSVRQAALLIDADNFSDPQAIDAAWTEFKAYAGRVSVCRAYGAGPRLEWLRSVWRYLGTRTFPNLPLEKNTTDAALIADAVALHFQQGVRLFAIASGDADFAPLAVRLREWGCEVWCFSMEGIVFRDAEAYYDRVKCFPAPVFTPAPAAPVSVKPTAPAAPVTPAAAPVAIPVPEEVQRILEVVANLRETPQPLAQVVPVLRAQAIFEKNTKCSVFFARYPEYFKLIPAQQPMQLRYMAPSAFESLSGAQTQKPPAQKTAVQTVRPSDKATQRSTVFKSDAAVLSWLVAIPRQATPRLLAELHGLRSVLLELALRRISAADVLLAAPEMLQGQPCALNAVAGRLRQKGLLQPYQSAVRVLQRHPGSFAVKMNCTPPAVVYLR